MSIWYCPACKRLTGPTGTCPVCGGACEYTQLETSA